VISITCAAVLSIFARPFVALLAGPQFLLAANILQVLAWSCVPVFLGIGTSQIIVNESLYSVSLLRTTTALIFIAAVVVPTAQRWGVIGVASAIVASSTVSTAMLLASSAGRQQILFLWRIRRRAQ